jgi:hypothetical protein
MLALLAALTLHVFTNGGPRDTGRGIIDIKDGRGTVTAERRSCVYKLRAEQIQRLTETVDRMKPKTWKPSYSSDCLECAGFTVDVNRKRVTFDGEARLPRDLERFRKALVRELDEANKRCPDPKQP